MLLASFFGPEAILIIFALLFAIVPLALTIWSCIDIARNEFRNENDKVIWILLCIFLTPIAPIIYYVKRDSLLAGHSQPIHRS